MSLAARAGRDNLDIMDPSQNPEEMPESNFTMIIAGLGGVVVLLVGLIGVTLATGTGVEPPAEEPSKVANAWPSKKDLGLSNKKYTPRKKKPKKDIKREGNPFGESSGYFQFISAPGFGKLKTRQDWQAKADELSAKRTSRALWELGHLYQNRRNPFRDDNSAYGYFQASWKKGAGAAAYELAVGYEKGKWNLDKDPHQAKWYYQKAEAYGISNATKDLERLKKKGI